MEGNQQVKPLENVSFFCRKNKHQLLLRGSSVANQGENTLQRSAIVYARHGIHLKKCRFPHLSEPPFSVSTGKQPFLCWNFSPFKCNFYICSDGSCNKYAALSMCCSLPELKVTSSDVDVLCCTFWLPGVTSPTLPTSSASLADFICSSLQFLLIPTAVQLYLLGQQCPRNTFGDAHPAVAVPARIAS